MLLLRAIKFYVSFACILRLALDEFSVSAIFCVLRLHIVFSPDRRCAFDEILSRLGKLIGEEIGGEYQLVFVCDFLSSPEISKENFGNKKRVDFANSDFRRRFENRRKLILRI